MGAVAELTVALAGNPNAGKTTLFNVLTGSRQHVGNWPGKTVERKQGLWRASGQDITVVDLPGTYSLAAYTVEEQIARDYLLESPPDVVVIVVDAAHLERNLYLVVQLLELRLNTVIALNMSDVAETRGIRIDAGALSEQLGGVPVVRVVATKGEGLEELRASVLTCHKHGAARVPGGWQVDYGPQFETAIASLQNLIDGKMSPSPGLDPRWCAVKLLEDEDAGIQRFEVDADLRASAQIARSTLAALVPDGLKVAFADRRYAAVSAAVARALTAVEERPSRSERVDRVVTSPWLGFPIFMVVMYLIFNLVVNVSAPFLDWIDAVISGPITAWSASLLASAPGWLQGLVLDGVIAGVGGVLVFVPGLIALFLFIAILEDSGYLARAAFVMHRLMGRIGLSGKSFVALILGFGCAVPAIYATRTLDTFRERVLTSLLVPLMSCAARLPVYVVFGIAFFGTNADLVVWGLYALGILVAVISAWLLTHTVLKPDGQQRRLLMELPSYRVPSPRTLWRYVSQRTAGFLQNAGTVILAASIVIWLLLNLPVGVQDLRHSWFGEISASLAPALEPAGFGSWETSGSLVTGLVAKEVVISTMSQIYTGEGAVDDVQPVSLSQGLRGMGSGFLEATRDAGQAMVATLLPFAGLTGDASEAPADTALGLALQRVFTPLSALAFLVFVLLYVPCVATLGAIRSEFGFRWALFSAAYQTGVAWLVSVGVYQVGTLLGYA